MKPSPKKPVDVRMRELRAYAKKTQIEAAALATMAQPELSRLERRDDYLLSTLRRYVEALGGSVEILVTLGSSAFRVVDGEQKPKEIAMDQVEEALATLQSLDAWVPALVAKLPAADLKKRVEGCGAYSLVEHVWHLRDIEVEAYGERLRRTLGEDCPKLPDVDGDALARERAYHAQPLEPALSELVKARKKHVAKLRKLAKTAFEREAELEGVGRVSLAGLVQRWRAHDTGHRIEMERLADALSAR